MNRSEFASCMAVLWLGVGRNMPADQAEVWFDCLKDLPLESLKLSVRQWLQEHDSGFPSIAALRKLALGCGSDSRPLLAWEAFRRAVGECGVYRSVDFDDPIINTTVRCLGGWERACEMEGDQFYVWYRKEFERTYETLCESGVAGEMCKRLTGACETEGSQSGHGSGEDVQVRFLTGLPQHQPRLNGVVQRRIETPVTEPPQCPTK